MSVLSPGTTGKPKGAAYSHRSTYLRLEKQKGRGLGDGPVHGFESVAFIWYRYDMVLLPRHD